MKGEGEGGWGEWSVKGGEEGREINDWHHHCYSFHLWPHSALAHLKKMVMGSSADLVCICIKYAFVCSHFGHVSAGHKQNNYGPTA